FVNGTVPVVSNLDAQASLIGEEARVKLGKQIISAVRWVDCVRYMINAGVELFIEFGPQKVLSGMIKNIDKDVRCHNVDHIEDIAALQELMS
ncbi:MAG: [acyl-carrier-protein] S-malonyltransferase, partial [Candidatus Cloacimonetes bacterium]|nr:[acyl-carrier-protein] S-malonyltransferase [Candidatus Cloacimonadota bacterium]